MTTTTILTILAAIYSFAIWAAYFHPDRVKESFAVEDSDAHRDQVSLVKFVINSPLLLLLYIMCYVIVAIGFIFYLSGEFAGWAHKKLIDKRK